MRLVIGKSTSRFESQGAYLSDSIQHSMADLPDNQANTQMLVDKLVAVPYSRFGFKIIKSRPTNLIYSYDMISTKLYTYLDEFPIAKWKVSSERSVIAGYSCQKATIAFAGRVFEAWFTREVPVSDGPHKFYGLPGLIVKVKDVKNHYIFELTSLKKLNQILTTALPKQAALTTKAALLQGKRNHYANLHITAMALTSKGSANSPELRTSEQNRIMKKFNNSLELR